MHGHAGLECHLLLAIVCQNGSPIKRPCAPCLLIGLTLSLPCSYGTHIVQRETSGVHQIMSLRVSFQSATDQQQFSGKLSAELKGTGPLKGNLNGGLNAMSKEGRNRTEIEVERFGKGLKHFAPCAPPC